LPSRERSIQAMSSFTQGFRSFLAGFDWSLIMGYWRAVREHAWEIFWGSGVPGIVFTIYTLYYAPARAYIPWAVAWAVLVAGYFIWRADHIRLEKKIEITRLQTQEWTIPQGSVNAGHHARAYYFEVFNQSEGDTVEGISVQLRAIIPEVPNLNWLPVHLHLKHDDPLKLESYVRNFDLNPREPRNVDLVSALQGDNRFTVLHTVFRANNIVPFDTEGHRLQVMLTAKNMSALLVWFKVWRDETGLIQCEIEK
jgi:hypothetical protein